MLGCAARRSGFAAADTVARPRAEHVPADDGRELDRPDEAGREPRRRRLEERQAEVADVPALLERVGEGDDDPLAVDQEIREVVGDEVARRDRDQAGDGRAEAHEPRHDHGARDDQPEEPEQLERLDRDARGAEDVEPGLGLGQAVEQDGGRSERDEDEVLEVPAGQEQARTRAVAGRRDRRPGRRSGRTARAVRAG